MKNKESKLPPLINIGIEPPFVFIEVSYENRIIKSRITPDVAEQIATTILRSAEIVRGVAN